MRYRPAATWVLAASLPLAAILGAAAETPISSDPKVDIGRRIYREGRLADGSLLRAIRPEGFVLEGGAGGLRHLSSGKRHGVRGRVTGTEPPGTAGRWPPPLCPGPLCRHLSE